jgi:predicted phosphodiesterase
VRVAALYDVHGNVHALEAVLADVEREGADVILFGGDLGWGPFPRETVELARSLSQAEFVRGNADEMSSPEAMGEAYADRRAFVVGRLDQEQVDWLETRPFSWSADDTLFVHANPKDIETPYFEWSSEEKLAAALTDVPESRVVSGHVHMQSNRAVGDKEWTCAGSVGFPHEDEPGAYWALLVDGVPQFRRTAYDTECAAAAVRSSGHPWAERYAAEIVRPETPATARATWGAALA